MHSKIPAFQHLLEMGILLWILMSFFLHADAQSNNYCPPIYLRYSQDHSYCKPAEPTCNIIMSSVSQGDIEVILREHNTWRNQIAMGQVKNLPAASNMMQMVWDNELAAVAQKHANRCKFEHDCADCRRVQNFGVGQNLASETSSPITPNQPVPNWPSAIKSWYDEIQYFPSSAIEPFVVSQGNPTYGHFSQLVWAESWRIGCGYVLYTEANAYKKLYVCNYGPAGNTVAGSMYKKGSLCTGCPINSCCGKTCGGAISYSGLCSITDNKAPVYKPNGNYLFYCDFRDQKSDCSNSVTGTNKWLVYNTLSGNYAGIVLKGGEESTMVFNNQVKPKSNSFCFVINYRKGPNVDGEEKAHTATEYFTIKSSNFEVKEDLPDFGKDARQQFSAFSMDLGWNMQTEFKVKFSVPVGKPEQFLEIQKVYATNGGCN